LIRWVRESLDGCFFPSSFSSLSPAKGIEVSPNPAAARHQTVINEPASRLFFFFSFSA